MIPAEYRHGFASPDNSCVKDHIVIVLDVIEWHSLAEQFFRTILVLSNLREFEHYSLTR